MVDVVFEFYFTCFACVYVCEQYVCLVPAEGRRKHQICWNWSHRQFASCHVVPGKEPRPLEHSQCSYLLRNSPDFKDLFWFFQAFISPHFPHIHSFSLSLSFSFFGLNPRPCGCLANALPLSYTLFLFVSEC